MPVSTITRPGNDLVLTTRDGATLFETVPRSVTFEPTAAYSAGTQGKAVLIDGVPVSAGSGGNTNASGSIAAMMQLRDEIAPEMQSQLDEVARGLINSFRETDPNGVQPDAAGLFTWPGGPALPAAGTLESGLAGVISVNAAMDSNRGGDPRLLRDGGANGAAYVGNSTGGAAYTDLLLTYSGRLEEPMTFDPAAGFDATMSVSDYSTEAISWFEGIRQDASRSADGKNALMARTSQALSNSTGVNIDDEMALLLDLEHSYQASARMMRTVDDMLNTLMSAVS